MSGLRGSSGPGGSLDSVIFSSVEIRGFCQQKQFRIPYLKRHVGTFLTDSSLGPASKFCCLLRDKDKELETSCQLPEVTKSLISKDPASVVDPTGVGHYNVQEVSFL